MRHRIFVIVVWALISITAIAQIPISIDFADTWSTDALRPYVGKTVVFTTPMYVVGNSSSILIAPKRIFHPNHFANPSDSRYSEVVRMQSIGILRLSGVRSGYPRCGEKIYNLTAYVRSEDELSFISGDYVGNTREILFRHLPNLDLRTNAAGDTLRHTLTVCAMNLEYYITELFDGQYGPRNYEEHQRQRKKTSKALAQIHADIYGLVEIQQGNSALQELSDDLSRNTGRQYRYISTSTSASGTYTQSGFVYCSDAVEPVGIVQNINKGVYDRKKMQAFREKSSGEVFLLSLNHFKAKSGSGTGADADKGQGSFNYTRTQEAQAVVSKYESFRTQLQDSDVLFVGDMNAYAKEDPILTFTDKGYIDLHRYFHADSSYSYVYHDQAGYLDHVLCNSTLLPQVTGMAAYHINSDERDEYTYDSSNDTTMFRSSDHDPILIGLLLGKHITSNSLYINEGDIYFNGQDIIIHGGFASDSRSYYTLSTIDGRQLIQQRILSSPCTITRPSTPGVYILNIYAHRKVAQYKLIIND